MSQVYGAVLRNEQVKSVLGTVRDKATAARISVSSPDALKELDIAVRKATSHEEVVPKEKHVRTIKQACASGSHGSKGDVEHVIHKLQKRLHNDHGWLVCVKALVTFHRLLREVDAGFHDALGSYSARAGGGRLVAVENYKDKMCNNTWDYSSWIRVYSAYLDERVHLYRRHRIDTDVHAESLASTLADRPTADLLETVASLQQNLHRLVGCVPEGDAATHVVCNAAAALVARECGHAHRAAHEGLAALAERAAGMGPTEASRALELYRRGLDLHSRALGYKSSLESNREVSRNARVAELQDPPGQGLQTLEEKAAAGAQPHGSARRASAGRSRLAPVLAKVQSAKAPATFARVEVRAPGIVKGDTTLPDMLTDLDSNGVTGKPAALAVEPTPAADPFGLMDSCVFAPQPAAAVEPSTFGNDPFGGSDLFAPAPAAPTMMTAPPSTPQPAVVAFAQDPFSAAVSSPSVQQQSFSPATPVKPSDPFGYSMQSPTNPFDAPMAFASPQRPQHQQHYSQELYSPSVSSGLVQQAPGDMLVMAGLAPTMLATQMAKTSVTDPFADLTSGAIRKPTTGRGLAMNAIKC